MYDSRWIHFTIVRSKVVYFILGGIILITEFQTEAPGPPGIPMRKK
jgi:hypothetical protein